MNPGTVCSDLGCDRLCYLDCEPGAVLDRPTVLIGAVIGVLGENCWTKYPLAPATLTPILRGEGMGMSVGVSLSHDTPP